MKNFFYSLLNFFNFIKIKNKKEKIIFYSESKFYREHFSDLIDNFIELKIEDTIFITSDYEDYIYHKNKLKSIFIHNGFFLHLFFQLLECKLMIMTLSDLGNYLKKSPNCKNYVYFFHCLSSTHIGYTKDAFKEYDTVLTTGNYQKIELLECEKKFNYPSKKIVNTGYFFLDHIKKKANLNKKIKNNILFAPSWNYNKNLFDDYALKIIEELIKNKYFVTLRPHPEHYKRSTKTISDIINTFNKNSNFYLDSDFSNLHSLEKSELLITDNSAIDMEYVLVFKKPVIHIKYVDKIHNDKINELSIPSIEEDFKRIFGNKIHINDLHDLSILINKLTSVSNNLNDKVDLFTKKYLSNLGNSSKFAVKYLISND